MKSMALRGIRILCDRSREIYEKVDLHRLVGCAYTFSAAESLGLP